jgi:hypothetical protein
MASNHKLTGVLKGRKLTSAQTQNGRLVIGFDDGSTMTVKIAAGNGNNAATGGTVRAVRQQDTTLNLDFESGNTLTIQTIEPTSSVMVRDKNGVLEYVD